MQFAVGTARADQFDAGCGQCSAELDYAGLVVNAEYRSHFGVPGFILFEGSRVAKFHEYEVSI